MPVMLHDPVKKKKKKIKGGKKVLICIYLGI